MRCGLHKKRMDGPPKIFDRKLLDRRRRRAAKAAVPGAAFLLEAVADDLVERLAAVERRFDLGAEIGSAGTALADRLIATGRVARLVRLDRLAEARPNIVGDEAALPFADGSLDLAVSALAFHALDDLPGTFAQIRRALKPDGLFLAAFAGGDSLTELRQSLAAAEGELAGGAAPRVFPFVEVRALGQLLQRAGFALPVTDQDRLTIRYAD